MSLGPCSSPRGRLELTGAMTHFATADDDGEFVARQLAAFAPFVEEMRRLAPRIIVHAAQQRGDAPRAREPLRHGALRDRDLRL